MASPWIYHALIQGIGYRFLLGTPLFLLFNSSGAHLPLSSHWFLPVRRVTPAELTGPPFSAALFLQPAGARDCLPPPGSEAPASRGQAVPRTPTTSPVPVHRALLLRPRRCAATSHKQFDEHVHGRCCGVPSTRQRRPHRTAAGARGAHRRIGPLAHTEQQQERQAIVRRRVEERRHGIISDDKIIVTADETWRRPIPRYATYTPRWTSMPRGKVHRDSQSDLQEQRCIGGARARRGDTGE